MATHYDDEAQVDAIRSWWKENWLALAGGLGLGLGAIFGWQAYQSTGEARVERAAQMYSDLRNAQAESRAESVTEIRDTLVREFSKTPYAALAQMKWAAQSINDEQVDDARAALQWVTQNARDEGLKSLARLRLARVEAQAGNSDAALALLSPVPKGYESLFLELRGDMLLLNGDRDGARVAYDEALVVAAPDAPYRRDLQRKRDDLTEASNL